MAAFFVGLSLISLVAFLFSARDARTSTSARSTPRSARSSARRRDRGAAAGDIATVIGLVHLGLGAFHRAHQAVYTEDAGGWEICGVAWRSRAVADALRRSGRALHAGRARAGRGSRARVDVIREALVAVDERRRWSSGWPRPTRAWSRLTITEGGYGGGMMLELLARGLAARAAAGVAEPLAVLSCDNVPRNGEATRRARRRRRPRRHLPVDGRRSHHARVR